MLATVNGRAETTESKRVMVLTYGASGLVRDCGVSSVLAIEILRCGRPSIQWNLSVTTTSTMKFITCDLISNVF